MRANIILILLALTFLLPNSKPIRMNDDLQIQIDVQDKDPVIEEKTVETCDGKTLKTSKTKRPVKNFFKRLRTK